MKKYISVKKETQYIKESLNYIYDNKTKNIEVLEGIETNLLIFHDNDEELNINIHKDSIVNIYDVILTNESRDLNITVNLLETGATCNCISLTLASINSNINSNICIYHNVDHTYSDLKCYCISKDKAVINLNNNAYIKNKSKGSIAKQQTKGLTLSDESIIKVQPNLFIDEFDVSASHGVAMGSLNKDDLFYLMSRGLSYNDASMIVILGFVSPIIDSIDDKKIGINIQDRFNTLLK